jgi:hypothetical protein
MEILGERPVWSMSGSEMLSSLDAVYAEIARLETFALHLIAGLETTGHAKKLGAGTTARLLTFRYRIDATKARRDVHLATSLAKFPAIAAALPDPNPLMDDGTTDDATTDADASDAGTTDAGASDAGTTDAAATDDGASGGDVTGNRVTDSGRGECGAGLRVLLHPAQAEAIVAALDKIPATVAADDLQVAEREMVELARTHGPLDLRKAGRLVRDFLDTDGPEPAEQEAYDRETLTLKNADNGVAFTGYLANENAELLRTLIHTHAKPHKTIDGALDPRPRTKRQADALTTILTSANNPTVKNRTVHHPPATADTAGTPGTAHSTSSTGSTGSTGRTPRHARAAAAVEPIDAAPAADTMRPDLPSHPRTAPTGNSSAPGGTGKRTRGGFIPGHGPKAHLTVTIDFNDLKTATADKLGHLTYGDGLSAATIRRLACDADILPIVLGSDSQPLDVGTTVRLATGPIRKALIARDKGCVCCGAPPLYCDAHHVISWIDGGETNITNLALLCKRCHRDLHAGHWNIHITNGIVHVARPAWATPNPVPHSKYRPPTTDLHPSEPTPGTTTRRTSGTTTPGAPARAWPRDTDPPWIAPDDTTRLNPWGDTPDHRATHAHAQPKHQNHQDSTPEPGPSRPPTSTFAPWGEDSDSRPNDRTSANEGQDCTDVWGDAVTPNPTVDRRSKLGADITPTFDPWGDLASESDSKPLGDHDSDCGHDGDGDGDHDGHGDHDNDSEPDRRATDPWRESTGPRGNTAAA